jgi:hypothetical protein
LVSSSASMVRPTSKKGVKSWCKGRWYMYYNVSEFNLQLNSNA